MKNAVFIVLFLLFGCKEKNIPDFADTGKPDAEVWNTVKAINRHWAVTENMDSLSLYLHDNMVMFSPGGKERLSGKENILESYRQYALSAETLDMTETEPLIQFYNGNKTAVVSYFCNLRIKTQEGDIGTFSCKDMYTLVAENGRWYAVAQHYSFIMP